MESNFNYTLQLPPEKILTHQTVRAVTLVFLVICTPVTIVLNIVVLVACKR